MSRRLQGQGAWISGGASGIGAATARLFASEGAKVAIIDVQNDAGRRLENSIRSSGGEALFLGCDVGLEDQVHSSLDQAAEHFGSLQIVVNGAGVVHVKRLHEYTEAEWDRLMAVNVRSIFFSVKHALPHLRKGPRSYVVNIGSISSFVGQAATPAYSASKAAVLGLSRSIALDYAADGVRCNCVCPGITDTPMPRHHLESTGDPGGALALPLHRVPMGGALTSTDVAWAVLHLSYEDSAGASGTSLVIDCGHLAAAEWDTPLLTLPDDLSWVQSVSLQRGDLPNSRPVCVIRRVPTGAFSTLARFNNGLQTARIEIDGHARKRSGNGPAGYCHGTLLEGSPRASRGGS